MTDHGDDVVYVGIGNSDDRLTQAEWANFMTEVHDVCMNQGTMVGAWFSPPVSSYQNACFCVGGVKPSRRDFMRRELGVLAAHYRQDSISWVEGKTVLVGAEVPA